MQLSSYADMLTDISTLEDTLQFQALQASSLANNFGRNKPSTFARLQFSRDNSYIDCKKRNCSVRLAHDEHDTPTLSM
uniref:Uncharacterized protein n=1 Tax=Parascaris equorum TaxID=6256 RepID=A0A914RL51_PAREQ